MGKFTIIVPPFDGHVNPTLAIGKALLEKGHEITWISPDAALEKKLPDGGNFFQIEINLSESEIKEIVNELQSKSTYGLDSLKFLYEDVLCPLNNHLLGGIYDFLEKNRPDIIIADQQMFAGAVAATKMGIPYVTSVTAPAAIKTVDALPKLHEWESNQIINFQKQNGIEGEQRIDCSSLLALVYTSKLFFGKTELPSNFKFIGPLIKERPMKIDFDWLRFEQMGNRPKILVSIGTTFDHEQKYAFFKKVAEALADEDLTVVVISDPEIFDEIPDNFIVQKRVPQLELLPYMDAVVSHGGQNTVSETLYNGIPLVLLPIAYDQSQVANSVVELNAGIRLNFNRFKAINLKDAIYTVLEEKQFAENAKRIGDSFKNAGGIKQAVVYLEELLHRVK